MFFKQNARQNDLLVDCSEGGESVADGCAFRYRAKLPTGTARAEAPGLSVAREKAEAVPVESEQAVAKINFSQKCTGNKR